MSKLFKKDLKEFEDTTKYLEFENEEDYTEYIIEKIAVELIEENLHLETISVDKLEARISSDLIMYSDIYKQKDMSMYFEKFYRKYNLKIYWYSSPVSNRHFFTKDYKINKRKVIIDEIL